MQNQRSSLCSTYKWYPFSTIFFKHISLDTSRSRIADHISRPRFDLLFLKIGMGNMSSGNLKSIDVFPVDCDVEE